jgi:hypothetical protein
MTAPVAFHIGYHKTATTWFQREIAPRHPRLRSFVEGSPHGSPFLAEIIGRSDRDFDADRARAAFAARHAELAPGAGDVVLVSAERLSGHVATGGYDTFRIARRLHETVPDACVFFSAREQVGMIESEYRQFVLEGGTGRLTTLLRRRPNWVSVGFDLGHYEYDRLADEYARLFGPDRVKVFSFAAVTAEPARHLAELAEFLGIGPWPDVPARVLSTPVNRGASPRLLGVRRALNRLRRTPLNPDPVLALPDVWRTPLAAVAARLPGPTRPLLDAETRAEIREHYTASNARLLERHGVHLA